MKGVICGISALEYWRTPPAVAALKIPLDQAVAPSPGGAGLPHGYFRPRANARDVESAVRRRLLADLKGLTLPVHVMVERQSGRRASRFVSYHRLSERIPERDMLAIGDGLSVLSPTAVLAAGWTGATVPQLALAMCELCGIYSLFHQTKLGAQAVLRLVEAGKLSGSGSQSSVREYCDPQGKPVTFVGGAGNLSSWRPSYGRGGRVASIWKRPPLATTEGIELQIEQMKGYPGLLRARRALKMARNGSGSPLESRALILLCAPRRSGGEGFGGAFVNQRIDFPDDVQRIAHQRYCIGDLVFPEGKTIVEVLGEEYHADRLGFKQGAARTLALESMGYDLLEVTYAQLANLDAFDAVCDILARKLGDPRQKPTAAFLQRREELHRGLFESRFA